MRAGVTGNVDDWDDSQSFPTTPLPFSENIQIDTAFI